VRIELDLPRLAGSIATPPLAEIVLLPALAQTLDVVAALFAAAHHALRNALPPPQPRLPRHLRVYGLDACVRNAVLPQSPRARKALCRELRALVEAKLPDPGDSTALLTFL